MWHNKLVGIIQQDTVTLGIIFGLLSMIGWGTSDYFCAVVSRKINYFLGLFYDWLVGSLLILLLAYFFKIPLTFTFNSVLISVLGGLLHSVANLALFKGFSVGKVGVVSSISSAYAVLVVILTIIFFGERLSLTQLLSVITVITGTFIVSTNFKNFSDFKALSISDRGVPYAFLTMVAWALGFVLLNKAVREVGWFTPFLIVSLTVNLVSFFYILFLKQSFRFSLNGSNVMMLILAAGFNIFGYLTYNFGVSHSVISIVTTLSGAYPFITASLALVLLRERLSIPQCAGIILIVLGAVGLNL